jgi:hypothetical protein
MVVLGVTFAAGSAVSAATTFDASAAAYGVLTTVTNESVPLGLVPEGSGPTAQAHLNSLPQSTAFASFPYPGDTLVGVPGLLGALVPGSPPLPPYPLYSNTELGDDPKDVDFPGIELHAESAESLAVSRAQSGSATTGYRATARVQASSDGGVVALADAHQSAIGLGTLATFDGIRSIAKVAVAPGGKPVRSSSLEIASIRVPAATLTIPKTTPQAPVPGVPTMALPLGGTTIHAPDLGFRDGSFVVAAPTGGDQKFAVPSGPVFQALAAVGITGTYQAAQLTPTGVIAPVLSFTAHLPAPPSNPAGIGGTTKVTLDFGRSIASVAAQSIDDGSGAVPFPPADPVGSSSGGSSGIGAAAGSSLGLPGGHGSTGVLSDASTAAPRVADPSSGGALSPTGLLRKLRRTSTLDVYLVLVGACFAGTLASQAVRLLGVRSSWTS